MTEKEQNSTKEENEELSYDDAVARIIDVLKLANLNYFEVKEIFKCIMDEIQCRIDEILIKKLDL